MTRMNQRVVDDLVVNMVDVGEETGELDTMLYKVADTYDEEVAVLDRKPDEPDGTVADHLPGRHGRLHRDRPVPAADRPDPEIEWLKTKEPIMNGNHKRA